MDKFQNELMEEGHTFLEEFPKKTCGGIIEGNATEILERTLGGIPRSIL